MKRNFKDFFSVIAGTAMMLIIGMMLVAAVTSTNTTIPAGAPNEVLGCVLFDGVTAAENGDTSGYCYTRGRNQFQLHIKTGGDTVTITPQVWDNEEWSNFDSPINTIAGDTNDWDWYPGLLTERFRVVLSDCESCTVTVTLKAIVR